MNPMTPKRTRKLRARAAIMNPHDEEFEDQGPEPNMKLSHAFLVVLLLHVIAVGGLYAFNRMKAEKRTTDTSSASMSSGKGGENPGNKGKNGPENPDEGKVPAVAKAPEQARVADSEGTAKIPTEGTRQAKGQFSGIREAVKKITAVGVATTAGKSMAQTNGSQSTGAAVQPVSPVGEHDTVTVHAGDTMTKIASSLGVSIIELEKANNLTGNSNLQVGQVLKVPARAGQAAETASTSEKDVPEKTGEVTPAPAAGTAPVTPQKPATGEYTVVKGDNPYKIAKRFKVTPDELMKANGISDPKKIQIGQKLSIPAPTKKGSK